LVRAAYVGPAGVAGLRVATAGKAAVRAAAASLAGKEVVTEVVGPEAAARRAEEKEGDSAETVAGEMEGVWQVEPEVAARVGEARAAGVGAVAKAAARVVEAEVVGAEAAARGAEEEEGEAAETEAGEREGVWQVEPEEEAQAGLAKAEVAPVAACLEAGTAGRPVETTAAAHSELARSRKARRDPKRLHYRERSHRSPPLATPAGMVSLVAPVAARWATAGYLEEGRVVVAAAAA
jgi:hypothetical protein